ncbi:hypothetical protein LAWI1_G002838 [Lachnellula willkommii]|uniref:Fungal-type protein kinase domain-containing protein n=1 Tax=Lachnellula willkommii TaxID=215461 RepID=A0A559MDM8_9HELO|nr:hypothetical protein LAWI1_G002838 [Lachnellula willkommii]
MATTSEAELGLNIFIKYNKTSKYIVAQDVRISLEDKLIASIKAIVNSSAESSRAYSRIRSLRRSRSSAACLTSMGISTSSTTISSSRQKRKRDGEFVDGKSGKRSRSIESRSNVADVEITVDAEKREPDTTGLAGCESETYGNRIHYCLVVSLAGRPLHAYRLVGELLEALRDAIRGYKSLLEDRKILYRDLSKNNIIIIEAATTGDLRGMLINLDLAKELDSLLSGASHWTSTI